MDSYLIVIVIVAMLTKIVFGSEPIPINQVNHHQQVTYKPFKENEYYTEDITEKSSKNDFSCDFALGLFPGPRDSVLRCCNKTVSKYERSWASRNLPLNQYLATLKNWDCPQFQQECERRLFVFNDFTELMYDYFCDYSHFVDKCIQNVTNALAQMQKREALMEEQDPDEIDVQSETLKKWKQVISFIDPSKMTLDELLQPCIQVAQYDLEETHNGSYQEVIDFGIPSCSVAWCGLGSEALKYHYVSVWSCLSSGCRTRVILIMAFCGLLGVVIATANLLIIFVISLNRHLKNSQATYKLSLAAADLIVGIVVLPCAIDTVRRLVWTRYELGTFHIVRGFSTMNQSLEENVVNISIYDKAGDFNTKFPKSFQNFVGFFVAISIFVSVYTLAGAGFDRLRAVYAPLSYRKQDAIKFAKKICFSSWLFAIAFALLPFFTPRLAYVLVLSIVFATLDVYGVILYGVSLFVPLVIVWIINLLTYTVSVKQSKFRRRMPPDSRKKRQIMERKLAATLRLMVGVFTFNTVPLLILLACSYSIPTIHPSLPESFNESHAVAFITAEFVALMLLLGNSMWNFFIYNIKNRDFRLELRKYFKKILRKLGFTSCFNCTLTCCRRAFYSGRRSFTSLQSFSRMSFTKQKKSSFTADTDVSGVVCVEDVAAQIFKNPEPLVDDNLPTTGVQMVTTESTIMVNENSLKKMRDTTHITYDDTSAATETLFD